MGREGQGVCLFKCTLCQRDKEFDGFIRNTKALFSRVRLTPLSSTQSADKLQKRKNPTSHQHPAQRGRQGEAGEGQRSKAGSLGGTVKLKGVGVGAGCGGNFRGSSPNTSGQAFFRSPGGLWRTLGPGGNAAIIFMLPGKWAGWRVVILDCFVSCCCPSASSAHPRLQVNPSGHWGWLGREGRAGLGVRRGFTQCRRDCQ